VVLSFLFTSESRIETTTTTKHLRGRAGGSNVVSKEVPYGLIPQLWKTTLGHLSSVRFDSPLLCYNDMYIDRSQHYFHSQLVCALWCSIALLMRQCPWTKMPMQKDFDLIVEDCLTNYHCTLKKSEVLMV